MAKKTAKAAAPKGRVEIARTASTCVGCSKQIDVGDKAVGRRHRYHAKCR